MTEAGLNEDNAKNKTVWRNKIKSYTDDARWRDKPGTKKNCVPTFQMELFQYESFKHARCQK